MQVQLDFTQEAGMPRRAGGFVPGIQASLWEVSCTGEAGLQVCIRGQSHVYVLRYEDSHKCLRSGPPGRQGYGTKPKDPWTWDNWDTAPRCPTERGTGTSTFSRRVTLVAHLNQPGSI